MPVIKQPDKISDGRFADVPKLVGHGSKLVAVKSDETRLEYILTSSFDASGAAAAAVAAHVALADPHTQYQLESGYTAADVLAKLLTVDGAGSGLDADLLDGNSSAAFVLTSAYTAADVLAKLLTVDGAGSGLDADLLDGSSSAAFEAAGTAAAAIVTHVGLADPHTQYQLESGYTAADVLTKLLTVDGAGSGLDADLLDGNSSAAFVLTSAYTAADVLAKLLTVDGAGSLLDADLLDSHSSAYFLPAADYTAADVLTKIKTVDGTGSGLDADLLDGSSIAEFALLNSAPVFTGLLTAASDTDALNILGRAKIGHVGHADYAAFSHFDQATTTNYGFMQHSGGTTYFNAPTGVGLHFRINNADVMNMNATGLRIGSATNPTVALDVTGAALISSTLGVTGVLTVASDTDVENILGRARIGYIGNADGAGFQHIDMDVDTTSYAIFQQPTGRTYLNCKTGVDLRFRYANTDVMLMDGTGLKIGAATAPASRLDITQPSTTAAIAAVSLTQADLSEEFIDFLGTVSTGNPINTDALGTYYGRVRIAVNGTFRWLALYNT